MSERWGDCTRCKGRGKMKSRDPVLLREEEGKEIECGICGGTGFSGSAEDRPDDHQVGF